MKTKEEIYAEDQKQVYNKLIKLLNVKDNNTFTVYDITKETKKEIILLLEDIKKYYLLTTFRSILKSKTLMMSIIRFLIKKNNNTLFKQECKDRNKVKYTIYAIVKKE